MGSAPRAPEADPYPFVTKMWSGGPAPVAKITVWHLGPPALWCAWYGWDDAHAVASGIATLIGFVPSLDDLLFCSDKHAHMPEVPLT